MATEHGSGNSNSWPSPWAAAAHRLPPPTAQTAASSTTSSSPRHRCPHSDQALLLQSSVAALDGFLKIACLCLVAIPILLSTGALAQGVDTGFHITSIVQSQYIDPAVGVALTTNRTTFTCSEGSYNFTTVNVTGQMSTYTVVCDTILQTYLEQPVWSVPWDTVVTQTVACLSNNPLIYNLSGGSLGPSLTRPPAPTIVRTGNNSAIPVGVSWGTVASIATVVGCSYANTLTFGLSGAFGGGCAPGGPYLTMDAFTNYEQGVNHTLMNLLNLTYGLITFESEATNNFNEINTAEQAIESYAQNTLYAVGNLTQYTTNLQSQINIIATQSAAGINKVQSEIQQVSGVTASLAVTFQSYAQATQSAFNQTLAEMASNNLQIVGQLNNVTTALNNEIRIRQSVDATTAQSLNTLASIVIAVTTQSQYLPLLAAEWQTQQLRMQINNNVGPGAPRNWLFFTDNLGVAGAPDVRNLPPTLAQYNIETPVWRYVYQAGAPGFYNPVAALSQYFWICSGLWATQNQVPITSWQNLFNSLGQFNCSVTDQRNNYCNCFVRVVEQECVMNSTDSSGSGIPWPQSLANWLAWDQPTVLPTNGQTWCSPQGGGVHSVPAIPGLVDNTIRSTADVLIYFAALCARGLSPAFGVPQGYRTYSSYFGRKTFAPFDPDMCDPVLSTLMNPLSATDSNLLYIITNGFIIPAMTFQMQAMSNISQQITGGLPYNSSITTQYFQETAQGPIGTCLTMSMVAVDVSRFVTVYRYTTASVLSNAAIYKDGQLLSVLSATDVSNSLDPNGGLLPPDGAYIACIQGECWMPGGSIYDLAYSTVTPDAPPARAGGFFALAFATTPVIPQPGTFNLSGWTAASQPYTFNQELGAASLMAARTPLLCDTRFDPPRCTCNSTARGPASTGNLCDMLEVYVVSPGHAIAGAGAAIEISSPFNVGTYVTDINIGPLALQIASVCPSILPTTPETNTATTQTLLLQSPSALPNFVRAVRGGACSGSDDLTLQPGTPFPYEIRFCPEQPVDQPIPVTFLINPSLGYYVPCNYTYGATIVPNNPAAFAPALFSTFGSSERLRAETTNNGLLTAQQFQLNTALALQQVVLTIADFAGINNLALSANPADNPLGALGYLLTTTIPQLVNNASTVASASQNYSFSYPPSLANYTAQNGLLNANALISIAAAQNATYALATSIAAQQVNIAQMYQTLQDNIALFNQSKVSLDVLNQITQQIIANAAAGGGTSLSLGDIFGPFGSFLTSVGSFTSGEADKAADLLRDLGGDVAGAASSLFGAGSGLLFDIIIVVVVLTVVGLAIYFAIKCGGCKTLADPAVDARMKQMEAQIAALQQRLGMTTGIPVAALPVVPVVAAPAAVAAAPPPAPPAAARAPPPRQPPRAGVPVTRGLHDGDRSAPYDPHYSSSSSELVRLEAGGDGLFFPGD